MEKPKYTLEFFQLLTGKAYNGMEVVPQATVILRLCEKQLIGTANGKGTLETLFEAIKNASGIDMKLEGSIDFSSWIDFSSSPPSERVEATVGVAHNDYLYVGSAYGGGMLESSVNAFVDALNNIHLRNG